VQDGELQYLKVLMAYLSLKVIVSIVTMFFPNMVKVFILNLFPGNDISPYSYLGFSLILSKRIVMKSGSRIGHFNLIKDIDMFLLEEGAVIHNFNRIKAFAEMRMGKKSILGSYNFISGVLALSKGGSRLILCDFVMVTAHHLFDLVGSIVINRNAVIAGNYTQFYTHAFDVNRDRIERDIIIGENSYVGSSCIILANIASNVIVGAGSTVYRDICEAGMWTSHRLEKIGPVIPIAYRPNLSAYEKSGYTFRVRK
jgi:acetyltransferase-like isoleucine patch superfamily enzyme